jgi:hypothetical protein
MAPLASVLTSVDVETLCKATSLALAGGAVQESINARTVAHGAMRRKGSRALRAGCVTSHALLQAEFGIRVPPLAAHAAAAAAALWAAAPFLRRAIQPLQHGIIAEHAAGAIVAADRACAASGTSRSVVASATDALRSVAVESITTIIFVNHASTTARRRLGAFLLIEGTHRARCAIVGTLRAISALAVAFLTLRNLTIKIAITAHSTTGLVHARRSRSRRIEQEGRRRFAFRAILGTSSRALGTGLMTLLADISSISEIITVANFRTTEHATAAASSTTGCLLHQVQVRVLRLASRAIVGSRIAMQARPLAGAAFVHVAEEFGITLCYTCTHAIRCNVVDVAEILARRLRGANTWAACTIRVRRTGTLVARFIARTALIEIIISVVTAITCLDTLGCGHIQIAIQRGARTATTCVRGHRAIGARSSTRLTFL